MTHFETISHKVSIAGEVTDSQTGNPISNAYVRISEAPAAFNSLLNIKAKQNDDTWNSMLERPDRTRTNANGHYHFMDLPKGKYTIVATLGDRYTRYGKAEIEVDVSDNTDEDFKYSEGDIKLPSTSVKGVITDKATDEPIVFAEVRVRGSGETTISNNKGEYLLNGLEATDNKSRGIQVVAKGYKLISRNIKLSQPGSVKTLNIGLEPL